jgi:protein regulator of cytokinesis 1
MPRSKSYDTPARHPYNNNSLLNMSQQHSTIDRTSNNSAAATPLHTPHGRSSLLMLSPSKTLSETLTSLASSTAQQLESIWDEIGYSAEDRAAQLNDLVTKMRDLCEEKIAEENGVAVTFRQTIADVKEEMRVTCKALRKTPDADWLRDNDGTLQLTDELQMLEAAMENMREAAKVAKNDLLECREYLIESHEALELEMDPTWRDVESDLTMPRREAFHKKKAEMKDELTTRSAAVIQLVQDCQHLMNDLRIDNDSGSELDARIAGSLIRSKDGSFMMASKFRTNTCVGIGASTVEELTKRMAELHAEKRRRKAKLQDMGAEIAMLWEKLRIPEEDQLAFTESVQGLGMATIEKGEAELKRLHFLKSSMLGNLIVEARETIRSLWDQINATREQRRRFDAYTFPENMFDEQLLDKHDEYITTLQTRLEEMKPVIRIIERREEILRERMEYEELQKDSERLQQRGASMTQQLMKEEKMARRIKKELPKLTETLLNHLAEWKEKHEEDFQYGGQVYLDVMEDQEQEWQEYKMNEHQRKQMKKQEEMALASENRFQAFPSKKNTGNSRPLIDVRVKENTRQAAVSRANANNLSKPQQQHGSRLRSETMT